MSDITRYRLYNDSDCIWEDDDGEVVWYEDHLAIVEKLKANISSLKSDVVVLNNLNTELEADVKYWRGRDND